MTSQFDTHAIANLIVCPTEIRQKSKLHLFDEFLVKIDQKYFV